MTENSPFRLHEGQTQWPVCHVLYCDVLRELIDRPKMGCGVPLHDWLRGWAEELLVKARSAKERYFLQAPIRPMWTKYWSERRNCMAQLSIVLLLQAWPQQP